MDGREDDLSKYINQLKSASDKVGLVEDSLDPYEWAKESWSYADFAYGSPEGKGPNRAYRTEAQEIIMNRMALAAVRLKLLIEGLEAKIEFVSCNIAFQFKSEQLAEAIQTVIA